PLVSPRTHLHPPPPTYIYSKGRQTNDTPLGRHVRQTPIHNLPPYPTPHLPEHLIAHSLLNPRIGRDTMLQPPNHLLQPLYLLIPLSNNTISLRPAAANLHQQSRVRSP